RAPAKLQSALLKVMQEHQVTIGKESFRVEEPFLVLATQNPIEADGTYPLPEAQIDRFMLKVLVGYPSFPEEVVVVDRIVGPEIEVQPVMGVYQLLELQRRARATYVDPAVINYPATLVTAPLPPATAGGPEVAAAIAHGPRPV